MTARLDGWIAYKLNLMECVMNVADVLRGMDPIELVHLYKQTGSIQKSLRILNLSGKARCTTELFKQIINNADPGIVKIVNIRNCYTIKDIQDAVNESICMSDVLRKLRLTTHGTCSKVIKRLMIAHNIDFSHFNIGEAMKRNRHRWDDSVFRENSPLPRASINAFVRRRMVLGPEICSECGISTQYNNKPIRLTVDHINGVNDDNRLTNLRWLCPNCHSQTETYCGKKSPIKKSIAQ